MLANGICYSLTGIGMYLVWRGVGGSLEEATAGGISGLVVLALSLCWAINRVGFHIGKMAENAIDSWQLLSYIKLTDGDDRQIERTKNRNKKSLGKGGLAFALGIGASVVANLITEYVLK